MAVWVVLEVGLADCIALEEFDNFDVVEVPNFDAVEQEVLLVADKPDNLEAVAGFLKDD